MNINNWHNGFLKPVFDDLMDMAIKFDLKFNAPEKFLLLLVVIYVSLSCLVAYTHGVLDRINFLLYLSAAKGTIINLSYIFILFICFKVLWWKLTIKPRPLFREWLEMLKQSVIDKDRLLGAIPLFIILLIFLSVASNMKGFISYYGEYSWDPFLAKLDKEIHFNTDPWRLLHPLLGHPVITAIINYLYSLWFGLLVFFLYWQLFEHRASRIRYQFYYTFILLWSINGTLMAILFASGGPCFYEPLTGESYYSGLMTYLYDVNKSYTITAIQLQEWLFAVYQKDKIMMGVGISAMPSMHVGIAYLFFLITSKKNKWIGKLFALYCLIILIGSVHLAWHYAIDGYIAIITTGIYWRLSGKLIDKLQASETDNNSQSLCDKTKKILEIER